MRPDRLHPRAASPALQRRPRLIASLEVQRRRARGWHARNHPRALHSPTPGLAAHSCAPLACVTRSYVACVNLAQDAAVAHYPAFIDMAAGLDATRSGLAGLAGRLDALAGALPRLAAAAEAFTAAAGRFAGERAQAKQLHRARPRRAPPPPPRPCLPTARAHAAHKLSTCSPHTAVRLRRTLVQRAACHKQGQTSDPSSPRMASSWHAARWRPQRTSPVPCRQLGAGAQWTSPISRRQAGAGAAWVTRPERPRRPARRAAGGVGGGAARWRPQRMSPVS